jgi:hypothetical protein
LFSIGQTSEHQGARVGLYGAGPAHRVVDSGHATEMKTKELEGYEPHA